MLEGMLLAAAFAAHGPHASDVFEDAYAFFGRTGGVEGTLTVAEYEEATHALAAQFSAICGDTFCAGDYNNIQPLSFDCSVGQESGKVADCVWTLAASATSINPTTGTLKVSKHVYECHVGVKGTVYELGTFLRAAATTRPGEADGLRQTVVPGTQKTLLTVLGECL